MAAGGMPDRTALKQIFDRFDEDKSGAVSTAEMASMCRALNLGMSKEQLTQMMKVADPDGSGEIDFEEFVTVLTTQIQGGGGGLANIFGAAASGLFGWANPLNWFGGGESAPAAPAKAPKAATPKSASSSPAPRASPPPPPPPPPPPLRRRCRTPRASR